MAFPERYLVGVLAAAAALFGPRAAGQGAAAGPPVEVKFTVFADGLPAALNFLPTPRSDPQQLQFLSTQRSRVYDYRGPNPIEFTADVRVPPDPTRPGALHTAPLAVARASVPTGVREALLLFTVEPGWEKQAVPRYVVQVFDDSRAAIPLEHLVFLNATGAALFGTVAGREVQVPLGLSRPVRIGAGETPVLLNVLHEGRTLPVYGDTIPLERNQRVTVVLFAPETPDSFQIRRRLLYDPDRLPNLPVRPEGDDAG